MIALLWQSTTVRILPYPFEVGRSVMKSMVMVSQIPSGISFGLSGTFSGGHILIVWHVAHPLMYALTNSMIPGHQYSLEISLIVFHCSRWPISPSWNCFVICCFSLLLFGTYTNPLYIIRPFS